MNPVDFQPFETAKKHLEPCNLVVFKKGKLFPHGRGFAQGSDSTLWRTNTNVPMVIAPLANIYIAENNLLPNR